MSDINTTVDGVRAIEMRYRAIWSSAEKLPAFYQSSIRLNSPDMGVLLPERFMPVIEADDRCISIFRLALLQTVKAAEKFNDRGLDFDWVSVFIPQMLLGKSNCVKTVRDFTAKIEAIPQGICFELPESVLANSGSCESIKQLRKAGYHIMLTGVDSERFPLFRLAELEPEYVMLNESITRRLGKDYDTDSCIPRLSAVLEQRPLQREFLLRKRQMSLVSLAAHISQAVKTECFRANLYQTGLSAGKIRHRTIHRNNIMSITG